MSLTHDGSTAAYCPDCGAYWVGYHNCPGTWQPSSSPDIVMNRPSSAVPLESMIEELLKDGACACELSVRYDAALDAYSVRLLDEDGETIVGRFRSSVHAGIQDVSGAWRERRNDADVL